MRSPEFIEPILDYLGPLVFTGAVFLGCSGAGYAAGDHFNSTSQQDVASAEVNLNEAEQAFQSIETEDECVRTTLNTIRMYGYPNIMNNPSELADALDLSCGESTDSIETAQEAVDANSNLVTAKHELEEAESTHDYTDTEKILFSLAGALAIPTLTIGIAIGLSGSSHPRRR